MDPSGTPMTTLTLLMRTSQDASRGRAGRRFTITIVAAVLAAATVVFAQQPAPPTPFADRAAHRDDSRRSADHGANAAERPAVLRAREPDTRGPCRASPGRQGRVGARRRRPARTGALRRAHELQRHATFSEAGRRRVHAEPRHAVRRARERPHRLRRDGLRAPDSDEQSRDHRPVAADSRGLGARTCSFDPEEVERERGVILEEWRLGLGAEARIRDAQMPVLLSGSRYAERLPIGQPDVIRTASRDAQAVLHGLVSARSDGGDCRRRLRSGGRREGHRRALRADSRRGVAAPASRTIGVPDRPGTRYTVTTDKEVTTTTVGVFGWMAARDQHDAGRLSSADGRTAVQRDALGAAGRNREQAGRAVSGGADLARAARAHRRSDHAQRARPRGRRRARARRRCWPRSNASPASASRRRSWIDRSSAPSSISNRR